MEAKMGQQQVALTVRAELTVPPLAPAITDEQLTSLQARIEALTWACT